MTFVKRVIGMIILAAKQPSNFFKDLFKLHEEDDEGVEDVDTPDSTPADSNPALED